MKKKGQSHFNVEISHWKSDCPHTHYFEWFQNKALRKKLILATNLLGWILIFR
jgi:hypothetical protein